MPAQGRKWVVSGRVQGVGYRAFVVREATALGLSGWTRNLADGRVEVFASGEASQLDALQGRLWQGPRWAEVRHVDAIEAPPESGTEFRVR